MSSIAEKSESRGFSVSLIGNDAANASYEYYAVGYANEASAVAAVKVVAPSVITIDGKTLRQKQANGDPTGAPNDWIVTVSYAIPTADEEDPTRIKKGISFGSMMVRTKQSLSTASKTAPAGETATDYKGAIGVSGDKVEGVDVSTPECKVWFEQTITNAEMSSRQAAWMAAHSKINSAAWKGYAAGTLLFVGVDASDNDDGTATARFNFLFGRDAANIVIGNITVASKKAWQYLWVSYAAEIDNAAKTLAQKPIAAYVENIYETADFSTLGLGS